MLTKLLAALAAAVGIGAAGVYFATSTTSGGQPAGCPLCAMMESATCPVSGGTCDTAVTYPAAVESTDCCPDGKCCANGSACCGTKVSAKSLATAAAVGCCAVGAE